MRDLKEFLKNKKDAQGTQNERSVKNKNADFAGNMHESQSFSSPDEIINAYSGKSKDELMQTLLSEVGKRKENGTFDTAEMDEFASRVAPLLNDTARKELDNIIGLLKR